MWPSLSRRPWRTIAAMTLALVLSFSSLSIALAETISAVEGPWTMSTSAVTYNCCGPDVYYWDRSNYIWRLLYIPGDSDPWLQRLNWMAPGR